MRTSAGLDLTNAQTAFSPASLFAGGEVGVLYDLNQATNLTNVIPSWQYNRSTNSNTAALTITNGTKTTLDQTAPDGTLTASTFTATSMPCSIQITQTVVVGRQFCASIYVKSLAGGNVLDIRTPNNEVTSVTISSNWQRIVISGTYTSGFGNYQILPRNVGDSFALWGQQNELDTLTPSPFQSVQLGTTSFPPYTFRITSDLNSYAVATTGARFALDQSKNLQLGSELVSNGTFNTDLTGWAVGATSGAVWNDGQARLVNSSGTGPANWFGVNLGASQSGKVFEINFDATWISGSNSLLVGSGSTSTTKFFVSQAMNGGVKQRYKFVIPIVNSTSPDNNFCINFATNGTATWDIDNVSCKEILGNHLYSTASSTGPANSNVYNSVTSQTDNLSSTNTGVTATQSLPSGNIGPSIYDTAFASFTNLTEDTSTGDHSTVGGGATNFSLTASVPQRISFYAQSVGRDWMAFEINTLANTLTFFNTTTGTVGTVGSAITSAAITDAGTSGGAKWWLITLDITPAATASYAPKFYLASANGTTSYTGSTSNILRLVRLDVRPINRITTQTVPQQRTTASLTTTNVLGLCPNSLSFDGVDDWMQTNAIPFTSNKVTCFAVILRRSDSANQMIFELGNAATQAFYLSIPTAASYQFQSAGSLAVQATTPTNYSSPRTNIVTCIGDISGDVCKVRVNGTEVASNTGDQGTGNYSNSLNLFVGRRGGSTLPFDGRLMYLLIINRACTATEIDNMESFLTKSFYIP